MNDKHVQEITDAIKVLTLFVCVIGGVIIVLLLKLNQQTCLKCALFATAKKGRIAIAHVINDLCQLN